MRRTFRWLMVVVIVLFLSSPVIGGWKEVVTKNQMKATEYIHQLKNGADPDSIAKPTLRRGKNFKAKKSFKEIKEVMAEAEALARAGKHNLIEEPVFIYKGVSEEKAKTLTIE